VLLGGLGVYQFFTWRARGQTILTLIIPLILLDAALCIALLLLLRSLLFKPLTAALDALQSQQLQTAQELRILTEALQSTETRMAEAEAARAQAVAAAANEKAQTLSDVERAKSEFLAGMSHELRTPLNGILGYTQILDRNADLTPQQRDAVKVIRQSSERLLTLINDLLDLSKIEEGNFMLCPANFSLSDLLSGITDEVKGYAQNKGLAFMVKVSPSLPQGIHADRKRLSQVLLNLLHNALKFTEQGNITLHVQEIAHHASATLTELRFAVSDTGVGIPATQLEKIFIPFESGANGKKPVDGSGVGLAISHKILERMGSELRVESAVERGSTFWFDLTLPVVTLPEQDSAPVEAVLPIEPPAPWMPPPQADLVALHEIARLGNMRKIGDWAAALGAQDARYRAFAEKVQALARSFQKKQLIALIEQHLEVYHDGF